MSDEVASRAKSGTGSDKVGFRQRPSSRDQTGSTARTQTTSRAHHPSHHSTQRDDRIVLDIGIALIEDIIKQKRNVNHEETAVSTQQSSQLVQDLLGGPPHEPLPPPQDELYPDLPNNEVAAELITSVFEKCFLLSEIVPKELFQQSGMRLFSLQTNDRTAAEREFLPMVYIVIALAYVVSWSMHNELGCENAVAKGTVYFQAAETLSKSREIASITQLRIHLCMIIFQMTTKGPRTAKRCLALARTATVKLGLYAQYAFQPRVRDMEDTPNQNLLWSVMYLDIYISGMLGCPSLAETSGTEAATLSAIRHAAQNVNRLVRSSQGLLLNVALALQIELFKVSRSIQIVVNAMVENEADQGVMSNEHFLETERLRQELVDWDVVMTNIFPKDEAIHVLARARFDLRMSHYLARIMLHYRYIRYHAESSSSVEDPLMLRRIKYGRICVETSQAAVTAAKEYSKVPAISPFSWPSAYALFLSTITLFVALTSAKGAEQQRIKDSILLSVLLMRQMACVAHEGTTSYFNFLEAMARDTSSIVDWQSRGQASDPTNRNPHLVPFMAGQSIRPLAASHKFNLDFLPLPEA